jgi:hypothetical protein
MGVPPACHGGGQFLTGSDQLGNLTAALIFLYLIVGMTAGAAMLNSWIEERSRGQSPSRPRLPARCR